MFDFSVIDAIQCVALLFVVNLEMLSQDQIKEF